LFHIDEEEELAEAAIRLARDTSLRKGMGKIGKEIVATHYSVEAELAQHQDLYHQLIQKMKQGSTPSRSRNLQVA
jgi:glycosyltransferase involved in cell wall biosynthesis